MTGRREKEEIDSLLHESREFVRGVIDRWEKSGGGSPMREWANRHSRKFENFLCEGPWGLMGVRCAIGNPRQAGKIREDGKVSSFLRKRFIDAYIWISRYCRENSISFAAYDHSIFNNIVYDIVISNNLNGRGYKRSHSHGFEIESDVTDFLLYDFATFLGMDRIPIIDEWIAITQEGFYLLDVPHTDLDRLDLRRDGVWFSEKALKAPNPPRPILPRPTMGKGAKPRRLWLRNGIFGEEYLFRRFERAVKSAAWIIRGEKSSEPRHATYQAVSWLVDGVPMLFQRDEHIYLENYDAASLEKLITWADKKLGACFTAAKPYDQEYYWCDPIDDDNELPEGITWDPTTCTLVPEDSVPTPAKAMSKPLLAKSSSPRSAQKNAVKPKSRQHTARKPARTAAESKSKSKRTPTKPATEKRTSIAKKKAQTRPSSPKSRKRS